MKTLKSLTFVSIIVILFSLSIGCKKDDKVQPSGLLRDYLVKLKSDTFAWGYYTSVDVEEGYQFTPKVDGYITSLGVKMSSADKYKIRVYSGSFNETRKAIANVEVDLPITNMWKYVSIPPLALKANTTYYITVYIPQHDSFYMSQDLIFPFETSNISIVNNVRILYITPTTKYLIGIDDIGGQINKIYGLPDFRFSPK